MCAGSYRFFTGVLSNYGISVTFVDFNNLELVEEAIKSNTKVFSILNEVLAVVNYWRENCYTDTGKLYIEGGGGGDSTCVCVHMNWKY